MLSLLMLLLSVLVAPQLHGASAKDLNWEFAGWEGGGCYPNVEFDPNVRGRIYLASDVSGLWRSDDNGKSWHFANKGLANLAVSEIRSTASSPNVVYAATRGGLFYSTNGARGWTAADSLKGRISFERPENYRSIAVDPRNSASVCVGTAGGEVFCSRNFGDTWQDMGLARPSTPGKHVTALLRRPDGSGLVAARSDGVYLYDPQARTWTAAKPALKAVSDLVSTPDGLFAAADGALWSADASGAQWHRRSGYHPGRLYRLAFDATSSRLYAAWEENWNGGVTVTTTRGESWARIDVDLKPDLRANPTRAWANLRSKLTGLQVSPFEPNLLIRTDWWGVWRSEDRGRTWTETIKGAPNTVGADLKFSPTGELFSATMDNGLMKSRDSGRTYSALFPSVGYRSDVNGHVWRVDFLGRGRIVASSSPWNKKINQVALSDDNGKTFRLVRSGLPAARPKVNTLWEEGYPRGIAVDPRDRKTAYLAIDGDDGGGLYVTRNNGETWSRSPGQPASLKIYNGLALDPANPDVIYWGAIGEKGGIYRSPDRGRTWQLAFAGSRAIFDIHAARDGAIYAAGEMNGPVLFKSQDQGQTWRQVAKFPEIGAAKAIASSPVDPKLVAVGTVSWTYHSPQSIHLSRDGGATWIDATGDLPIGSGASALTFSPDGRQLFVSRSAGGIYRLDIPR